MNILLITYQGGVAGSTNSISYLAKGLGERGHQVYVACPQENLLYQLVENMPVTRIPMTFKGKLDGENMRQIRDAVLKYDIQIINAQSSLDRYTVAFAKWRYRLPVHIVHTRRQRPLSMGGWLQRWFYTTTTSKIVAVSNSIKEDLVQRMGFSESHIAVINNGTPPEKYRPHNPEKTKSLQEKYQLAPDAFVIGCVSRYKKQEQLLEALLYIQNPVMLFLVGIEDNPTFQAITSRYSVPHQVFYTGIISGEETLEYYGLFNIKVLPSTMEGLSQSLLEAMYQGVPVVATRAAGNIDLISNEENGLFFEDGDVQGLANTIQRLRNDQSLYEKLKLAGERTAKEDFSIEKTVTGYERLFQSLLDDTQS